MEPHSILRLRAWWLPVAIAVTVWVGACVDERRLTGDQEPRIVAWRGIVSDPVSSGAPAASGSTRSLAASSASDLVYVSLAPGTIPNGELAVISHRGTGSAVVAAMVAGGLDPVPVAATAGDTLDIDVRLSGSDSTLHFAHVVAARRRPIVVRTDPPPQKRDVPLNAVIVIVFSEPIDPSTMTGESVQLRRGTTAVAGRLEFRDPARLTAAFVPDAPLAAGTEYQLVVTQGIRDLDGEPLEGSVTVAFTTGSTVLQAASVTVMPETLRAAALPLEVWVQAIVKDANGSEILNAPVQWSSSDSSVARPHSNTWNAGRAVTLLNGDALGSAAITATSGGYSGTETVVVDLVALSAVSVGANAETCALTPSGAAFCEGGNQNGQLGIGFAGLGSGRLVGVTGGLTFTAISTGFAHRCVLTSSGAAYCWGSNAYGQVGVPPSYAEPMPVPVSGGLSFRQISTGFTHSCGLAASGDAYCWGGGSEVDNHGQLGHGSVSNSSTPVAVVGGLTFAEISAGEWNHTCGLTRGGAAYCWGWNEYGQLGNGAFTDSASPVAVAGGLTFAHISAGAAHTCAVTTEGAAYCWGDGGAGTGMPGTYPRSASPELMPLPLGVALAHIDAGYDATCGLTADGAAYCWGWDIGRDAWVPPRRVAGSITFVSVSSGYQRWCGGTREAAVYCESWFEVP